MARIQCKENPGRLSAVITVDGVAVGEIVMTGPGTYSIRTEGRVPAIDGVSGASPHSAWNAAVPIILADGAMYNATPVKIGPYES